MAEKNAENSKIFRIFRLFRTFRIKKTSMGNLKAGTHEPPASSGGVPPALAALVKSQFSDGARYTRRRSEVFAELLNGASQECRYGG